ncbi:temptin-like [Mytilus trossulus]|uniref:temptin-like n=1 Tax=Mytilus trossulus TaxID=6551 RepID=UPI003004CFCE
MNQVRVYRFELFIFILSLWIVSECFPNFKSRIPNGDKIPNPCVPGQIWHAIGHWHPVRGVERNQFGLDFKKAGLIYTVAFHYQDSDGDGLTNGQELNVNLTSNQFYMEGNPLSHPGICEPVASEKCRKLQQFRCPPPINQNSNMMRNLMPNFPQGNPFG